MISTSDNIWKDRTMKSMETIAELNETICRLRKHIVTADTEHGELVLRLAAKERECELLRTFYRNCRSDAYDPGEAEFGCVRQHAAAYVANTEANIKAAAGGEGK